MTRVLVLGGTGHIGSAIARQFDAEGNAVRAAGRSATPRENLQGTGITQLAGDDTDPQTVAAWLAETDLVVDAATPYPIWLHGGGARDAVASATARMRAVLDATRRAGAAFIHISSFTTLPASGGVQDRIRLATVRGLHPYFEVKQAVERQVLAALSQGLKGAVLNPAACFGPYDLKPVEQAYIPMLLAGKVAGTVAHPVNVVDVRDVAACASAVLARGFPFRQVPVTGHNIRVDALTRQICALGGVAPPRLRAPLLLAMTGAYWAETTYALMGRDGPWPSLPILLTAAGRAMSISAEQTALGIRPRPLDQTLRDALDWYRRIGRC